MILNVGNDTKPFNSIEYLDLIDLSKEFNLSVTESIKTGVSLTTTVSNNKRSFSTLRRVKTWK